MGNDNASSSQAFSRRTVLQLAVGASGLLIGGALASPAQATATMPKKVVAYQDTPKGKARCDNCRQWAAPDACKIVAGTISAAGWCSIYAAKA